MMTLEQLLNDMGARIDRDALDMYVAREWLRPANTPAGLSFEDIDVARLRLVVHLRDNMGVNDNGIDVSLSLLDQLYDLRRHMRNLTEALAQQPAHVRNEITLTIETLLRETGVP